MTPNNLIIGFVPLLDCATLVAAVNKGFTAAEGLEITLVRETSWANIRDRIMVGHFDAAQMLGPMTVASSLGIGHLTFPMIAPIALGLGGNAITVSNSLWQSMQDQGAQLGAGPTQQGKALQQVVAQRARDQQPPLNLGMVYPFSCHNYELRYWLAASGIDPDRDVNLVVIPPPLLVAALREGQVDGFCVGEPWNSLAVEAGVGTIVTSGHAIWRLSPEKVLGCRSDWADRHPEQLAGLIRAIYKAAQWCEQPDNHAELALLLAQPRYVGAPTEILRRTLGCKLRLSSDSEPVHIPEFFVPSRHTATFPWASHALWFYTQMVRWQQTPFSVANMAVARATYRPDLYRNALKKLGVATPMTDFKTELSTENSFALTASNDALSFTAEGFFDGKAFEPTAVEEYIQTFKT
ncbi:MAG: CmpA/NrtA family ABC transporter substrate-binding protein [Steroidobacteraceae bacterium]